MMRRQDQFFSDNYTDQKTLVLLSKLFPVIGVFPSIVPLNVPLHAATTSDLNKQNLAASNRPTVHQSIMEPVPVIKSPKTSIQFAEDSMQLHLGI